MSRTLPSQPSLEHLKNQAKDLRQAVLAQEPEAISRIAAQLPGLVKNIASCSLAHAQYVLAREYGFASWPKLNKHILQFASEVVLRPSPGQNVAEPVAHRKHAHLLTMAEHLRRKPHVIELTDQLVALANASETEDLLDQFSRMPGRLILAVRANVLEHGDYPAIRDCILAGLEHPRARVRQHAAHLLDTFADDQCVEPLRQALEDPIPRVRRTAFHALTCADCKPAPLRTATDLTAIRIKHALDDSNLRIRREVTKGLGEVCYDERVIAALETILAKETDELLCANARRALEQQRGRA